MTAKKTKKGLAILYIIFFLVLVTTGVLVYFWFQTDQSIFNNDNVKATPSPTNSAKKSPVPTPTAEPFEFQEMTIPYLRRQSFFSSIDGLEMVADNSSYTSYLTSYDSEGDRVIGLLFVPKGDMPKDGWPAVVFVHGYIPPQEYRTRENYTSYAEYLAEQGLVVFKIDLRGHGDSEGEPFGAYYAETYVVDTLNAHNALSKLEYVNKNKIGLWGHSMGGNVVFRSFVANPDIKKVVIWAGAVYTYEDFSDYQIEDNSYQPPAADSERRRRRERLFETYGDFDPESEFWSQIVPTNYLDGISGRVEIHHATNDNVVKIDYSRNLVSILDKFNIQNRLYEYSSGGHNLTGSSFNQAMDRSAEFLKE